MSITRPLNVFFSSVYHINFAHTAATPPTAPSRLTEPHTSNTRSAPFHLCLLPYAARGAFPVSPCFLQVRGVFAQLCRNQPGGGEWARDQDRSRSSWGIQMTQVYDDGLRRLKRHCGAGKIQVKQDA
ncbi:hypothetical protein C0995_005504 [Termitomyces sp. Mi166|nr:hypothetical protein C0995_005504 [Termitomyces sp. Mi166\